MADVHHRMDDFISSTSSLWYYLAGLLLSYNVWADWLQRVHDGAAWAAPILGGALAITQIYRNVTASRDRGNK